MDLFPPLSQQLLWIALLSFLSLIALKVIRYKQLLALPDKAPVVISLKTFLINFGFYLVFLSFIAPNLFPFIKGPYLRSPLVTLAMVQLVCMALISCFILVSLKLQNIKLITAPTHYKKAFGLIILYLLVIFPLVSLIGQFFDTFLYLVYDLKGYEQVAVTFLKKTLHQPLALIGSVISIVIFAPLTEELLFRGILLNYLHKWFGSWPAVIISGALFALFHFSPAQGLGNIPLLAALSFFGIMLGAFYLRTRTLFYPIMLHAIFNVLSSLRILFLDP